MDKYEINKSTLAIIPISKNCSKVSLYVTIPNLSLSFSVHLRKDKGRFSVPISSPLTQ